MNIDEIHKARRMMKAIYRLADQPDPTNLSDIRYFARAGVIQLNRMLEQASREDHDSHADFGMPMRDNRQPAGMSYRN